MEAHWKECHQAEEGILSYPIVGLLRLMGKGQVWQELHGGGLSAGLVAFCRKCSVSLGSGALCQGLCGLCTIKAGAWFLANQYRLQQGYPLPVLFITLLDRISRGLRDSSLGTMGFQLCFLHMMSCWLVWDMLEGLCLLACLGTPWDPPRRVGEVSRDREVWYSLLWLLPCDLVLDKAKERCLAGWMDGWILITVLLFFVQCLSPTGRHRLSKWPCWN